MAGFPPPSISCPWQSCMNPAACMGWSCKQTRVGSLCLLSADSPGASCPDRVHWSLNSAKYINTKLEKPPLTLPGLLAFLFKYVLCWIGPKWTPERIPRKRIWPSLAWLFTPEIWFWRISLMQARNTPCDYHVQSKYSRAERLLRWRIIWQRISNNG